MQPGACQDCGATEVSTYLDSVPLCDRCADRRVSRLTGFPELPEPPEPITIRDPSGGSRTLRFRMWRVPTGIEVEIEETGVREGGGYQRAILGAHDADPGELVARLHSLAIDEVGRQYLELNPHRPGWLLVDDVVEGHLVWSEGHETGAPYDVVVDGRTLSWEEFGRTLEAYEGWRFRMELADRIDDVRPDASVTPLAPRGPNAEASVRPTLPSIDEVLEEFLAEERARLAARTYRNYESVVDLLRSCLNNYGHQELGPAERMRFEVAFETDENAFVHLFGPTELIASLPEFLGYFMIRKVMAGEELLRAAGTVTKKLARWMADRGYLDAALAAAAADRAADATRDLPRAGRLSSILNEYAHETVVDLNSLDDDDYLEDYLSIERVDRGALWFEGGIGPVDVPVAASNLAQPGWSASVTIARLRGVWRLVGIGNVYP